MKRLSSCPSSTVSVPKVASVETPILISLQSKADLTADFIMYGTQMQERHSEKLGKTQNKVKVIPLDSVCPVHYEISCNKNLNTIPMSSSGIASIAEYWSCKISLSTSLGVHSAYGFLPTSHTCKKMFKMLVILKNRPDL